MLIYVISIIKLDDKISANDIKKCGRFDNAEACIKIGYAKNESRLSAYVTGSPKYYELYRIQGGSSSDETRLHNYFDKYRDDGLNGREWFRWSKEIIDFFETYKTIEEIRDVLDKAKIPYSNTTIAEIKKAEEHILPILYILIDLNLIDEIIQDLPDLDSLNEDQKTYIKVNKLLEYYFSQIARSIPRSTEEFVEFLKNKFSEDKFNKVLDRYNYILNLGLKEEITNYRKNSIFLDQMKFICDLSDRLDEEKFRFFLYFVNKEQRNFYIIFGPKRLKTFGYQGSKIEAELNSTISNQSVEDILTENIYSNFKVGGNYSKEYIKTTLKSIYEKLNYNKAAKASDLERWFQIKLSKVLNKETGKRDNGFKILSKK